MTAPSVPLARHEPAFSSTDRCRDMEGAVISKRAASSDVVSFALDR